MAKRTNRFVGRTKTFRKTNKSRRSGEEFFNVMFRILEKNKTVQSKKHLEGLPILQIEGLTANGTERLIVPELRERIGNEILELDENFQILLPMVKEGVLVIPSGDTITHYEHFQVFDDDSSKFSLLIEDYLMYGKSFTLASVITASNISKLVPTAPVNISYENADDFFFSKYKEEIKERLLYAEREWLHDTLIMFTSSEEVHSTVYNTLAIFRAVNFLTEFGFKKGQTINNNEYFSIKNWNGIRTLPISSRSEIQSISKNDFYNEICTLNSGYRIVPKGFTDYLINRIIQENDIHTVYIAVGFAYKSGLKLIEKSLEKVSKNGEISLVVGALQHFDHEKTGNKIDRNSVICLKEFVEKYKISLFTYRPSFYHGKFYYIHGNNRVFVITGSSNVSNSAYNENYELDMIYSLSYKEAMPFLMWYQQFEKKCTIITQLDESKFPFANWNSEQDVFKRVEYTSVSVDSIQREINMLSDEDKKFRMNLWVKHEPEDIVKDMGVKALKQYIMFVYSKEHIVVFDAFIPNNAYYIFRYDDLEDFIIDISNKSKTELRLSEYSVSVGNHLKDRKNLEKKVNMIFTQCRTREKN